MKNLLASFILIFHVSIIVAQVSDIINEKTSSAHYYYKNNGQLIDQIGNLRPDILYHTDFMSTTMYFKEDLVSFVEVIRDTVDTLLYSHRIDMRFNCEFGSEDENPCGILKDYERTASLNSYFQGHCPTGVKVNGNKGIFYEDAFNGIDVHFYSNEVGPKTFFVIEPHADPNDINLEFIGQDSIEIDSNGTLQMYIADQSMEFPEATAYTIDAGGNMTAMSWLPIWVDQGGGNVSISTSSYNTSETLVIRLAGFVNTMTAANNNLIWSSSLGNGVKDGINSNEAGTKIKVDSEGNIFALGQAYQSTYPITTGQQQYSWKWDNLIVRFDSDYAKTHVTFFGSGSHDLPIDMDISESQELVYVVGKCVGYTVNGNFSFPSSNNGTFVQSNFNGGDEGYLAAFELKDLNFYWSTLYGGSGDDAINSIDVDDSKNAIYIVGTTTSSSSTSNCSPSSGKFPICYNGSKFNSSYSGNYDGFISKFDFNHALIWGTYFGGAENDFVDDVLSVNQNNIEVLYVVGGTKSHASFPLHTKSGSSGGYNQTSSESTNSKSGYILEFDSQDDQIWGTYFGGEKNDHILGIDINDNDDITVLGKTRSSDNISACNNSWPDFPICNSNSVSYIDNVHNGLEKNFVARFNNSGQLKWSTYYKIGDMTNSTLINDDNNNLYVAGRAVGDENATFSATCPSPYQFCDNKFGDTYLNWLYKDNEGVLTMFDKNNQLKWVTLFGQNTNINNGSQRFTGMDILNNEKIYLIGGSDHKIFKKCPTGSYCHQNTSNSSDLMLAVFDIEGISTNIQDRSPNEGTIKVFPNPVSFENLFVEIHNNYSSNMELEIIDVLGNVMFKENIKIDSNNSLIEIDVERLPRGFYILKIHGNDFKMINKFVKE